ncbi:MAG: hypothetical protein IKW89_07420 [Bacteroidales bacterium]|nr:hypothetical protein [Bacteroidales bacterium]
MEAVGNLKSLTMDELASVIKNWPWFGAARRELCERMSKMGGSEWGKEQYADAAMYIASRTIVSDIVRSSRKEDYSDKDVQTLLKRFIVPAAKPEENSSTVSIPKPYRRTVRVAGADFFSSDEYEGVKVDEDNYFSKFKVARSEESDSRGWEDPELGFCTETLAWIYADQGYYAEAKKIYSRLMLRYPEKIAYFATLIEKLDEEIKK